MSVTAGLTTSKKLAWIALTAGCIAILSAAFAVLQEDSGRLVWFAFTAAAMTIVVLVAELRRVDAAKSVSERANMAKGRFLANISQEIRGPMDGIVGMTDLLLLSGLAADQREYALTVKSSAGALLKMLNEMLDYARIIDGQVQFTHCDFEFHELIENVVERHAISANNRGVELVCHISPNVPEVVCGDPVRVQQVVDQLVSNAVKFTNAGRVCVLTRWLGQSDHEHIIQIEVRDTGIGIPYRDRLFVFDSYSAFRGGRTARAGGIGLAIAKQIVTRARGTIDFDSELGRGSTFWVILPFGRSNITVPVSGRPAALVGKRVLVASSSSCSRNMIVDYCRSFGMKTVEESTPEPVSARLQDTRDLDLAIVDDCMVGNAAQAALDLPILALAINGTPLPEGFRVLQRPIRRRRLQLTLTDLLTKNEGVKAEGLPAPRQTLSLP